MQGDMAVILSKLKTCLHVYNFLRKIVLASPGELINNYLFWEFCLLHTHELFGKKEIISQFNCLKKAPILPLTQLLPATLVEKFFFLSAIGPPLIKYI